MSAEFLVQRLRRTMRAFQCYKSHYSGSFQLIGPSNNRRFSHRRVRNQGTFDFRRSESVSANVNYIVDTPHDPEISVRVAPRAVSGKVNSVNLRPILLFVPLVIAPDCPQHRWPWTLDHEVAALVWTD